jgi:hypothetical protein
MDLGAVAIVCFLVGLSGCEVEGTGDFFIKEDIAHRFADGWMEAEGELADVACAFIAIEDLVDLFGFPLASALMILPLENSSLMPSKGMP